MYRYMCVHGVVASEHQDGWNDMALKMRILCTTYLMAGLAESNVSFRYTHANDKKGIVAVYVLMPLMLSRRILLVDI